MRRSKPLWLAAICCAGGLVVGCNALTGVSDLTILGGGSGGAVDASQEPGDDAALDASQDSGGSGGQAGEGGSGGTAGTDGGASGNGGGGGAGGASDAAHDAVDETPWEAGQDAVAEACLTNDLRCNGLDLEVCTGGAWVLQQSCKIACDQTACVTVVDVAAGGSHSCAVLSNNTIKCWGNGQSGQLGNGESGAGPILHEKPIPTLWDGAITAVQIAASVGSTCVRASNGDVSCWGGNELGQLGNGDWGTGALSSTPTTPVPVQAKDLQLGTWAASCIITTSDTVMCWGCELNGAECGQGPIDSSPSYVMGLSNVSALAVGAGFACALGSFDAATGLYCWGNNSNGQLGNNTKNPASTPVLVYGGNTWTRVGTSNIAAWGRSDEPKMYGWGFAGEGTTATSSTGDLEIPTLWTTPALDVVQSHGGMRHACGLVRDTGLPAGQYRVYCWGKDVHGQVGGATQNAIHTVPIQVKQNGVAVVATRLAVGWEHNCAIAPGGERVLCWGNNGEAQLGNGTHDTGYPWNPNPVDVQF